ncbi:MAG TPA: hypothetical protein VFP25_01910 [Nitrososphaeraceae archaeon]|nr:hypothetical protein [Nitrososphaeraceae archaeon]
MQHIILNPKKITRMITVNCTHCGNEIKVWRSKYQKAIEQFKGHIYCNRKCSIAHQVPIYEKFYWCDNGCKWIPKHSVIKFKEKGSVGANKQYRLRKDCYICSRCKKPLDMRRNESQVKKSKLKRLCVELPRIE